MCDPFFSVNQMNLVLFVSIDAKKTSRKSRGA